MAYIITDNCVSCGSCEATCQKEAISMGDDHYVIDATKCEECGDCVAACPIEAIVEE